MSTTANADPAELAKFGDLAHRWWDPQGEFRPLHEINPLRLGWIDGLAGLKGKRVLDLGCNAGFWSLNAAEAGADFVLGVDGRQIQVVTYDDKSSASDAVRAFQRAASEDKVNLVIASYISEVVLALMPWAARLKTPMITPGRAFFRCLTRPRS